ncbi:MAG: alpha/beta hydrolase [Pseudomonadales bacterium]|nr:alpha/beta hydrolase [Pseudomonadales bacterium]MCP5357200.1 alpha/beta hydrolase [Pseudomonadales bacterium]
MHSRAMNTPPLSLPDRMPAPRSDSVHLVQLPDERRLAYTEYGDRLGYPLFHFHSHGSCRLEAAALHQVAKRSGFRIIAVDRPGVGLSDPHRANSADAFAQDLEVLATQLRCRQYGLIACGGGLASALAFAARSGQRASMLLGMSCSLPCTAERKGLFRNLLCALVQRLVQGVIVLRHWRGAAALQARVQRFVDAMPYADRRMFENPAVMQLLTMDITEALRQGAGGVASDTVQQFEPLQVNLSALTLPCEFWLGSADSVSVRQRTENLMGLLPNARMHPLANRGRYFYLRHADEVFARANQVLGRAANAVVHQADFAFRRAVHENRMVAATR